MGKYFNSNKYDENNNPIDNKKRVKYVSDPNTNTLITEESPAVNDELKIKKPKAKPEIKISNIKKAEIKKPKINIKKPKINIKMPKFNLKKPDFKFNINVKFNKKLLIIPVVFIILLSVIIAIIKSNNKEFDLRNTDAFFLPDHNSKYALFNEKGKQLTDFKFNTVSDFINNAALVHNNDDQMGIINNKGKMVVDFGEYPYIFNEGPLYFLTDYETDYFLINAKGKKIYKKIGFEIISFGDAYTLIKKDGKFILLNYQGKKIYSFKDETIEVPPALSEKDNILIIYYNNKVYLFDLEKAKKMTSFDSKIGYCVTAVSNKRNVIINACDISGDILTPYNYKVIKNNSIKYDLVFDDNVSLEFYDDYVVSVKGDQTYLLNDSGSAVTSLSTGGFYNIKNYLQINEDGYINIYYHNHFKRSIDCKKVISSYNSDGIYLVGECENNKYRFYKKNGNQIGSDYTSATPFKNGVAIIEDNGKYYLVNKKMKKISKGYSGIRESAVDNYYIASADNKEYILDKKGKAIISGYKIEISDIKTNFGYMAIIDDNNMYQVYNITKDKVITSVIDQPTIDKHFFMVVKGEGINYYSYHNGNKFFGSQK